MQYVKFDTSVIMLVADGSDVPALESNLSCTLLDIPGVNRLLVSSRPEVRPAREGTCRIGEHPFHTAWGFPGDREVPDVCPEHYITAVEQEHAAMFDHIRDATNGELQPRIWHSGGGTMTIVIPITTAPAEDWKAPLYMGLQEDTNSLGRWAGTVGYYATEEDVEDNVETTIVGSSKYEYSGQEWAQKVIDHYRLLRATPSGD